MVGAGHAEVTPNDLSATLHGNAIFQKSVENTSVWRPNTARTDARTDGRRLGARAPSTTHAGKKYAVWGDPPLTPIWTSGSGSP